MLPIHSFSQGVLAEILQRQPASKEKTSFAWQLAVGPALARVTTVELRDDTLIVRAVDPRWGKEVARASEVILRRLAHLLGPAVRRITLAEDR